MRPSAVVVVLFAVFGAVVGRLQPAENVFPTDVNKALLPNVRQSLNGSFSPPLLVRTAIAMCNYGSMICF